MRHFSFLFYALSLTLLIVNGCSLTDSNESATDRAITDFSRFSQDSTLLVGEWHWSRTVCCFGDYGVETPETTGEMETLVVTEDDSVEVYRNEKLEERTTLDDYLNRAQWGVTEDTLVVSLAYIDGPQDVYIRGK